MATLVETRELSTGSIGAVRQRRLLILTAVTIGVSVEVARLVLAWDFASITFVYGLIAIGSVLVSPRYGLYVVFAMVLAFESSRSWDPLMEPGRYFSTSPQESISLPGAILFPLEMFLLLATGTWLLKAAMSRRLDFRAGPLGIPMLLFALSLVVGVLHGFMAGGVFNFVLWETRFLFAMALTFLLTANVIRTRGHLQTLMTLIMLGVGFSSIEGIWRKFALADAGLLGSVTETWFSHEGVVTWGTLIMLVFAQQVFGAPRWQRVIGPLMVLLTGFTMLVSERRAGFIAVIVAFLMFALILWRTRRKAFFAVAVPILVLGAIYLPLFWNNTGTFGQPARAVRSINDPDPRDAASNAWRDLEAINVRATIFSNPVLGIGFGLPFLQVVQVPAIPFFYWDYWSHHAILWLWMKGGMFTFISFFALMNAGIARGVWLVRTRGDPELRTFAIVAVSAIVMSIVFSYVDLGLTSTRLPVLMGVMLGVISVMDRISTSEKQVELAR